MIAFAAFVTALFAVRNLSGSRSGFANPFAPSAVFLQGSALTETFDRSRLGTLGLRFQSTASRVRRRYQDMLRLMEREGVVVHAGETPREVVTRASRHYRERGFQNRASAALTLGDIYERVRYVDTRQESREMIKLADQAWGQFRQSTPG